MNSVRLTFVGSGDAFGSGGRFQTCILIEAGATRVLLDCGASSLIAMRRAGLEPLDLDGVLLSHLHGDHFGGLPFLILDAQFRHRTRPLVIAGPAGVEARVRTTMEALFPGSASVERQFALKFLDMADGRETIVAGLGVTPYEVVHASGAPALALRVHANGRVVAYSGDTEWTDALVTAARGADLFICEAYFFDKRVKYHLDYRTLMEHRTALDCKRLVLTHMSEDMLARASFLDVECAHDGLTLEV